MINGTLVYLPRIVARIRVGHNVGKAPLTFHAPFAMRIVLAALLDEGIAMKVSLSFNDESYKILQRMRERWEFVSDAETIREALAIMRALLEQDEEGYSEVEVIVQNSDGDRRSLDIEFLRRQVTH